ncbi:MAG: DUF4292 domain-containing protein [Flavobacteriia bacterium]|nr:DUF4292 domain-containing protein [Flavobacteriia bacterium]
MKRISLIPIIVVAATTISCAKKNTVASVPFVPPLPKDTLVVVKSDHQELDSIHNQNWHWYYGKYSVSYADNSRKFGFKLSLKCTKDSAANAIISFAAIPFVNSLITKDSLLFLNKKDRCFGVYPVERTKKFLGIALTLKNLEELFLGLPLGHEAHQDIQRSIEGDTLHIQCAAEAWTLNYKLLTTYKRIVSQRITLTDGRSMYVTYPEWNADKLQIPKSILITIQDKEEVIQVKLTKDRHELDVPHEILVEIPEDYETCN